MVMTKEQKIAKEHAAKFITYLYKKYYPQIEAEMEKREEAQDSASSRVLFKIRLPFFSYLCYNK